MIQLGRAVGYVFVARYLPVDTEMPCGRVALVSGRAFGSDCRLDLALALNLTWLRATQCSFHVSNHIPVMQSGSTGRAREWVHIKCQHADQTGIMFWLGHLFLSVLGRFHELMVAGCCCQHSIRDDGRNICFVKETKTSSKVALKF